MYTMIHGTTITTYHAFSSLLPCGPSRQSTKFLLAALLARDFAGAWLVVEGATTEKKEAEAVLRPEGSAGGWAR